MMGEVIRLPRPPRAAPEAPPPSPTAPAVALPAAASFLAIVGFRRGLGFALQGKAPDPSSADAVLRGYRLGQRLLSQPLVDWQPTHPRFRRRRHF